MEFDELIKGVRELYNCCETRAVNIIAKRVNNGQRKQLEQEISENKKVVES